MIKTVLVFIGGGIGSVFRYLMAGWVYSLLGSSFPYGTLFVNITGSFIIGFFLTLAEDKFLIAPDIRAFVAIGIVGGFTTFSTFSYETFKLLRSGSFFIGALNMMVSITLALIVVWVGSIVATLI